MGYALFTRAPEGLTPTPEGEALRDQAQAMETAGEALRRAAVGEGMEAAGAVRLSCSEVVAAEVLPGVLQRIGSRRPALAFEVSVSNQAEDLLRRDADIAVRMTRPQQDGLLIRKVLEVELGLFAHPAYLARRPAPLTPEELADHDLIGFDTARDYTRVLQFAGRPLSREQFRFRSDSDMAQLGAIRAGCGVGVCHAPLAQGLTRVLPQDFQPRIEVWLAMHEDLARTPRCLTAFRDLALELKRYGERPHEGGL